MFYLTYAICNQQVLSYMVADLHSKMQNHAKVVQKGGQSNSGGQVELEVNTLEKIFILPWRQVQGGCSKSLA